MLVPAFVLLRGLSVTPVVFGGPRTKGNPATPGLSSTHSLYLITALISLLAASSLPVHANYSINYTHIRGASWQISVRFVTSAHPFCCAHWHTRARSLLEVRL